MPATQTHRGRCDTKSRWEEADAVVPIRSCDSALEVLNMQGHEPETPLGENEVGVKIKAAIGGFGSCP